MAYVRSCFALSAALAVTPTRGDAARYQTQGSILISALQWNPHWECFEQSSDCKANVLDLLAERLSNGTDFANVVELETSAMALPSGFDSISSACGRDLTTLFFNASRWKAMASPASRQKGCMVAEDRPYVVQAFEHLSDNLRVLVVGAHFPHRDLGTALSDSIRAVGNATGIDSVLLIADTNVNRPHAWPLCPASLCRSNVDLLRALKVPRADGTLGTDLLKTCCRNPPYGFAFEFDRIIANFGSAMSTELYDDPAPNWTVGAFHKGIIGRLLVHPQTGRQSTDTRDEAVVV